jgi:hypothetical protein
VWWWSLHPRSSGSIPDDGTPDHSLCDQTVIWPTAADRRFGNWLVVWSAAVTTAFDSPGITIETVLCRR